MGRSTRVNEFRTLEKHGVSFGEASSVFLDPYFRATDDPSANDRFIALGVSRLARLLFVVHLERGEKVRNIGMSQKRIEVALGQRPLLGRLNGRVESLSAIAQISAISGPGIVRVHAGAASGSTAPGRHFLKRTWRALAHRASFGCAESESSCWR